MSFKINGVDSNDFCKKHGAVVRECTSKQSIIRDKEKYRVFTWGLKLTMPPATIGAALSEIIEETFGGIELEIDGFKTEAVRDYIDVNVGDTTSYLYLSLLCIGKNNEKELSND